MKSIVLQEYIPEYVAKFDLDKVVEIEQQYSVRSYETGKYDIRVDGNLKCILNIISMIDDDSYRFIISVPYVNQLKNGVDDINWLLSIDNRISVHEVQYGENAVANRKKGISLSSVPRMRITYFSVEEREHTIFLCPGSPRPENKLYSMEEKPWFEKQIDESFVTVFLNENQHIYGTRYDRKIYELADFVIPPKPSTYLGSIEKEFVERVDYYFPYRLTDPDYFFENVLRLTEKSGAVIGITDPNNSFETLSYKEKYRHRIVKLNPASHVSYLTWIKEHTAINIGRVVKVIISDDLNSTIHMGPVETIGFLRDHPHKIAHFNVAETNRQEANRCLVEGYKR